MYIYIAGPLYIYYQPTGLVRRVLTNNPGDWGSIPDWVIPKTQKKLDTTLLNIQHYKVQIKGKVQQLKERSSAFSQQLGAVANEKEAFQSPLTMVANFTYYIYIYIVYIYINRIQH